MSATVRVRCRSIASLALSFLIAAGCGKQAHPPPVPEPAEPAPQASPYVVVYSAMSEAQLQPVLDAYTVETGARVHVEFGDAETLIERMADRRRTPPADLFVADNVADLVTAVERDLLRPTRSSMLQERTLPPWRDPENLWFGLTLRASVFLYRRDTVDPDVVARLTDYGAITTEEWLGRICLSSSSVRRNQSLIAMLITQLGARDAELTVRGWRANFAIPPLEDDAALIQALVQGRCELGIVPSHLAVRAARGNTDLTTQWPLATNRVHVDVSGAGISRHAANPDKARSLLEWMTGETPNALLAALAVELPGNPRSPIDQQLMHPGSVSSELTNVAVFGYLQEDARLLAERARYP